MKDYKLVILDLDGTLLDTTGGILSSVSYTINLLHLPMLSREVLLSFIGPPISDSFAKYYGLSGMLLQRAVDTFRDDYGNNKLFDATPYPGIYDVFEHLRKCDVTTAIATYKREDQALRLLHHYNFNSYTDIIFGADKDNKLQKKDIITKCIHKSNLTTPKVLIVGDTMHDAMGAERLGLDFLAVTYGFGFKSSDDLSCANAVAFVESPQEFIQWFNS
jgi:phosphoglycolate phosphatase